MPIRNAHSLGVHQALNATLAVSNLIQVQCHKLFALAAVIVFKITSVAHGNSVINEGDSIAVRDAGGPSDRRAAATCHRWRQARVIDFHVSKSGIAWKRPKPNHGKAVVAIDVGGRVRGARARLNVPLIRQAVCAGLWHVVAVHPHAFKLVNVGGHRVEGKGRVGKCNRACGRGVGAEGQRGVGDVHCDNRCAGVDACRQSARARVDTVDVRPDGEVCRVAQAGDDSLVGRRGAQRSGSESAEVWVIGERRTVLADTLGADSKVLGSVVQIALDNGV